MATSDLKIEQFERSRLRAGFDSGVPPLDDFLKTLVSRYEERNLGRTYVAVREGDPKVLGYYTIANGTVAFEDLPPVVAKKLPRHSVPVVLIARLAVDRGAQGRRLGEKLLMDALARSVELSEKIGVHAVVVDAIDEQAKTFYEKYQFKSLADSGLHLYLPIATISAAFSRA